MPRPALLLLIGTMILGATSAFADDTPTDRPNVTHRQLMQKCLAEHKAQANGASVDEMKKKCEEEIKSYRDHPSATSPETAPRP